MKAKGSVELLVNNILYSCVDEKKRNNEQFVADHALGYIISGEVHFVPATGTEIYKAGTTGLVKRNQLLKSVKVPPPGGQFKAINIFFEQEALRRYSAQHNISADHKYSGSPLLFLTPDPFIKGFFDSLLPYFDSRAQITPSMGHIKTSEAIELLLQHDPELKNFLFDFSEPYKTDLEAFMNQNYMFNVPAAQFAKLTGRSLAGFKRDFEKIFSTAPGLWLQQKRLEQAYGMIKNEGKKPSDVYLDVGFENLSHFSFAFKKAYGVPPSLV